MLRILPFTLTFLTLGLPLAGLQPDPSPLPYRAPVKEKVFPLLAAIERSNAAAGALLRHPVLTGIAVARRAGVVKSMNSCALDVPCHLASFRWSEAEVTQVEQVLRAAYRSEPSVRDLADTQLRRSGLFQRYSEMPGDQLLAAAWRDAARTMNRIADIYGEGQPPRYPAIDAVAYDVKSEAFRRLIHITVTVVEDQRPVSGLFFDLPLRLSLALLEISRRDEAGRFEPMHEGENRAAYQRANSVRWDDYPYTVIVVPGAGSDRPGVPLSAWGRLRLVLAAKRFHERKAPFVLVSGGYVHPDQTPYCEAIEMKKVLIRDLGVPENAILVDPHARHTTTNLRNAARIIYRYGFPFQRKALITTDLYQSRYIEAPLFNERCLKEMSHLPHRIVSRLSPSDLEFLPQVEALHADSEDPLDP